MTGHATVLGGGVAGIAAAFALRDRGWTVELLEARNRLGGRVFSYPDRKLGSDLDNGPHVMLGCYDAMRQLLRRIGTEGQFEQPRSLSLVYRDDRGRTSLLALPALPVPLVMPWAVAGLRGLSVGERLRAIRGMVSSLRGAPAAWTFEEWLERRGQHGGPRRYLWDPLCLAVMNAEAHEVSAALFLATIVRAFRWSAAGAAIWVPKAPWSEIVGDAARRALERDGVTVALGTAVRSVSMRDDRVIELAVSDGTRVIGESDAVVSALPWHRYARLWPEHAGPVAALEGRDIVNVYFDCGDASPIPVEGPLVGLVDGTPFQFVYRTPGAPAGRFALIASGCESLKRASVAEIEASARAEVARFYPGSTLPDDVRIRTTKESRATLCVDPSVIATRPLPGRHPSVSNLWLCGDWTQTHLPSTLEGAAASGFAAVPG